jgi:hypothetical protein
VVALVTGTVSGTVPLIGAGTGKKAGDHEGSELAHRVLEHDLVASHPDVEKVPPMASIDILRTTGRGSPLPPASVPTAAPATVHIGEDAFVSEAAVAGWVRAGVATRAGALLTTNDGRAFLLRDAVRVLGRRNGDTDPYGFTGRVESIRDFIRNGASISTDALRLGQAVYDIEYGYLAAPGDAR